MEGKLKFFIAVAIILGLIISLLIKYWFYAQIWDHIGG